MDLVPDELLLKLALVVALAAMPGSTLELSGELSAGDVIELQTGATTQWLVCDPDGWRPITEPVNRGGTPLTAATVCRHLAARRATR